MAAKFARTGLATRGWDSRAPASRQSGVVSGPVLATALGGM